MAFSHSDMPLYELFLIENPARGFVTCSGFAKTRGRRCHNRIAQESVYTIKRSLRTLARGVQSRREAERCLIEIADFALCKAYHRDQKEEIAAEWMDNLQTAGIELWPSTRRPRRVPASNLETPPSTPRNVSTRLLRAEPATPSGPSSSRGYPTPPPSSDRPRPFSSASSPAIARSYPASTVETPTTETPAAETPTRVRRTNNSTLSRDISPTPPPARRETQIDTPPPARRETQTDTPPPARREPQVDAPPAPLPQVQTPITPPRETPSRTNSTTLSPQTPQGSRQPAIPQPCGRTHVTRRTLSLGSDCSICMFPLNNTLSTPSRGPALLWCKKQCGQVFHYECIMDWIDEKQDEGRTPRCCFW